MTIFYFIFFIIGFWYVSSEKLNVISFVIRRFIVRIGHGHEKNVPLMPPRWGQPLLANPHFCMVLT